MAFQVRTRSGEVKEAENLAAEIMKRYGDRLIVSDVYPIRVRKVYQLSCTFESRYMAKSYGLAFKSLQGDIRRLDPKARVIEFVDDEVKRTRGQKTYPYKARVTLTAVSQRAVEYFDRRIDSISKMYGMEAKVLQ